MALTQQLLGRKKAAAEWGRRLQAFARDLLERNYITLARSCMARLALLQGNLNPALEWVRSFDEPSAPAELFMWLEAPAITQARVLIAAGSAQSLSQAAKLLRSLRDLCESCRFKCQVIEIAALQSLALERQGRAEEALEALKDALALGEPGWWIRPFVEAGAPMADLLMQLQKQNIFADYIETLLAATADHAHTGSSNPPKPDARTARLAQPQPLVEPLSHRELDVLELLAKRLQNKEIAQKLVISPITVKTHLKNIYQKLSVKKRREAVEKACLLKILSDK
jgi:LuxR family maltose regulon positive regulatory protein